MIWEMERGLQTQELMGARIEARSSAWKRDECGLALGDGREDGQGVDWKYVLEEVSQEPLLGWMVRV